MAKCQTEQRINRTTKKPKAGQVRMEHVPKVYAVIAGVVMTVAVACVSWADPAGQGVKLGPGVRMFPTLASEFVYEDNLYYTADNEQDATGLRLRPGLDLGISSGSSQYQIFYRGEATFYDTVSADDYFDNSISAQAKFAPLTRHRFGVRADLIYEHTPFGLDRTEGTPREDRSLDEYRDRRLELGYTFGAPTAKINMELKGGFYDREYQTNTDTTRFLDYEAPSIGVTALYRNSPRTTLLLELEQRDVQYDHPTARPRDGDEQRIAAGVRWLATAKTQGVLKIGKFERDFDSDLRSDFSNTDWQFELNWSPLTYSTVKFQTSRVSRESYFDAADFIDIRNLGVEWRHEWSPLIVSTLALNQQDNTYEGDPLGREDDIHSFRAGLEYKLTRQLSLTGLYAYTDRDSNIDVAPINLDYTRNTVILGIKAAY